MAEETGLECALEDELPSTSYRDARDRPERCATRTLGVVGGTLAFDHEVDGGRWVSPADGAGLLTYERDLAVLQALEEQASD